MGGSETLEYIALLAQAEDELDGPQAKAWLDRFEQEHDKIRTALRWIVQRQDAEHGLQLCAVLWRFWMDRGHLDEGRQWLNAILAVPGADGRTPILARARYGAGMLAFRQGDQAAARSFHRRSVEISRELNDQEGIATVLMGLARVALREGDYATIRRLSEESLAISRERGSRQSMAGPLHMLAAAARMEGDYARARVFYNENLALNRELGNDQRVAVELGNLASLEMYEGNLKQAAALYRESLRMSHEQKNMYLIPYGLLGFGELAVAEGDLDRGASLLGAAEAQFEATGAIMDPDERSPYERSVATARTLMGEAEFASVRDEGRAMTLEQAIAYALGEAM